MAQVKAELAEAHGPPQVVDASRIIDACAEMIRPLAEQRSIRLACVVPAGLQLRTQPDRLRAILINLLGNAVEYSPHGAEVGLTCALRDERRLEIRIRDTGPGFRPSTCRTFSSRSTGSIRRRNHRTIWDSACFSCAHMPARSAANARWNPRPAGRDVHHHAARNDELRR
jgi:light-regulated signal transduction histidine kinase (bacteriophytochrome)